MSPPSRSVAAVPVDNVVACRCCGLVHRQVPLERHEKALCVRCGARIARGRTASWDRPLAWALAGLVLSVPAMLLPLATVGRFGSFHEGLWLTAIRTLWTGNMPTLAAGVLICGLLAPVAVLILLTVVLLPLRFQGSLSPALQSLLRMVHHGVQWSMPEVYLLAVLVAFIKLGAIVTVTIGPGLWCYAGVSFALIQALHTFDFEQAVRAFRKPA